MLIGLGLFKFPKINDPEKGKETTEHISEHLAYKLGDLIGTLADEKQEMNLNMQAILSNDINVIWKNVNTLCTVEKLTDGDKWGIRIKDESTEKFLKNDIVIWANDCSESYSLDFEVILNKKHESIYKEMNPVVNVLKEQGLVTEVEDFIEKFNVLLHY